VVIEKLVFKLAGIIYQGNSNLEGMSSDMEALFNKAKQRIQILTGGFSEKTYCRERILASIKRALDREISVEVVAGPDANEVSLKTWSSLAIPIYILDQWPTRHFAIVDDKHVRVEEPHPSGTEKQVQYIVYNFKNVDELKREFEEEREHANIFADVKVV
jgi:sugar-specific transcriptional regulator TrmB